MAAIAGACAVLFLLPISFVAGGPLPPYNLKCEGNLVGLDSEQLKHLSMHRLLGTDNPYPFLSWTVAHTDRSARQSAFQVIVADDLNLKNVVWDSSKLPNVEETSLTYAGPSLRTGRTYFWKVIWWDHNGERAMSEETGHFLAAVLDLNDWDAAKWIAAGEEIKTAPFLYNTFEIKSSDVVNATLFLSGLGYSQPFVNGTDLNAQYNPPIALTPGWTNFEKMVPYTVYDVTMQTKKCDKLTVGVILGLGRRNTVDFPPKDPGGLPQSDATERVLKMLLYVTYKDSTNVTLVSDESWKVDDTNVTSDTIYNGETYNSSQYDQRVLGASVRVVTGPMGKMHLSEMPYIAEVGIEKPVKLYPLRDMNGNVLSQVADFGNNSAGYCRVYCDDDSSCNFTVRHAEVPLHPPYGKMDGSLYYGNLRGAKATDIYYGEAKTAYKPSFTYHGFRYAEVKGLMQTTLSNENIQKILVHANVQRNSKFYSSIPLLNNIQENCVRAQLSNLFSIVTGCTQRDERCGWMGDAALSAESMELNIDMVALHTNFVLLMENELINGTIPDVVPFYRYGSRPGDPSWSAAYPEIFYRIATFGKNVKVMEQFYAGVLDYIQTTVNSIPEQGISKIPNCRYGDWVPPPPNPKVDSSITGAFTLLMNIKQLKEVAQMLGKTDDANKLEQTFTKLIAEFNEGFMTSDTQYLNGIQATYVLPLAIGAVPANKMDGLVKAFLNRLEDPKQDNSHLTGGIITNRQLLPVLSQIKQHDIALKIAQHLDYPSYGLMIHNNLEPATALWELWNSLNGSAGMDSRNHHMFSCISSWMVTDMAGLSLPNGFNKIHFHPARALGLSHVSVSLEHPKPVHLSWRRNGGVQCAKQAENQSPLNTNLPKHNDLAISCGDEDGGTIRKILFSSYGNPTGHCGGYHKRGSCHAPNSEEVVEKLCLGKRSCVVPTGADFWGNPCSDQVKWLSVAVQCKSVDAKDDEFVFSSIKVNVSVPMGSSGLLHLPAHGKQNMKLWDGEKMIFSESSNLIPTLGIMSANWESETDSLVLGLDSGNYNFVWKGDNPQRRCHDSRSSSVGQMLLLECTNSTDVITTINWASYGTPELTKDSCFTYMLGECHAGSSKYALEKECLGKSKCLVHVSESFFGKLDCLEYKEQRGHLITEYTCTPRKHI